MKTSAFVDLMTETNRQLLDLTSSKGREYAGSTDQLANFKRLGESLGMSPSAILWVYMSKHLDSICTHIKCPKAGLSEPITGRINDAILYLHLLKAIEVENGGFCESPEPGVAEPVKAKSLGDWMEEIAQWANQVFPDRTVGGSLYKLVLEEIPEFVGSDMTDPLEYADLIILILDLAFLRGIDVEKALIEKMAINRGRSWEKNPLTGAMSHV